MGTVEGLSFSLSLPLGILIGGTVVIRYSVRLAHGVPPSPPHVESKCAHLNLLVLVYNLSKFEDPTRLCSYKAT
jgi:cytochrome b561